MRWSGFNSYQCFFKAQLIMTLMVIQLKKWVPATGRRHVHFLRGENVPGSEPHLYSSCRKRQLDIKHLFVFYRLNLSGTLDVCHTCSLVSDVKHFLPPIHFSSLAERVVSCQTEEELHRRSSFEGNTDRNKWRGHTIAPLCHHGPLKTCYRLQNTHLKYMKTNAVSCLVWSSCLWSCLMEKSHWLYLVFTNLLQTQFTLGNQINKINKYIFFIDLSQTD